MQTALLVACGLLLVGFVLRAKLRALQVLYVPAAVAGGIVGLILISFLAPRQFQLAAEFEDRLSGAEMHVEVVQAFAAHGVQLTPKATGSALKPGHRWRIVDSGKAFVIVKEREGLNVYGARFGWDTRAVVEHLSSWPGWLIAVIFAGLLIERPGKSLRQSLRLACRQGIVVWIIVLGETVVGLLATWLIIKRSDAFAHVPGAFGQLIEAGFAGGHGTAAALGEVYRDQLGFPEGRDLAFFFATVGLVYGVATGIVFVNIAVRRGWTAAADVKIPVLSGLEQRTDPKPIAFGRVRAEVIDPMVFQVLILATAFIVGLAFKSIFTSVVGGIPQILDMDQQTAKNVTKFAGKLPTFMFTLGGGLFVREAMHFLKLGDLIDSEAMRRITGAAMEFLIVAAIASLNIWALAEFGWPIALLLLVGFLWTAFCLLVIARWLLPSDYWFELGILNYGMSTGTTAQGMMLLRIVDKDLNCGAAEDYALAAPLSAPFIGGGVITVLVLPTMLESRGMGVVIAALLVVLAVLLTVGWQLSRKKVG